jgi:hypothetical protein
MFRDPETGAMYESEEAYVKALRLKVGEEFTLEPVTIFPEKTFRVSGRDAAGFYTVVPVSETS